MAVAMLAGVAWAADWPEWGGHDGKNMAADEKGLPDVFVPGEKKPDGSGIDLVTNRCEVICLDASGLANGNLGTFKDEDRYVVEPGQPPVKLGPTDADILWRYDIIGELGVWPHDAANCSVLVHGDLVYACTSLGGSDEDPCHSPDAPSLIVLDKRTGRLVGWDQEKIGRRVYHGQWSSPSLGKVGDRWQVIFGAGDGICYAFEAFRGVPEKPEPLKKIWWYQCNPPERLYTRKGKLRNYWDVDRRNHTGNQNDGKYLGPSEIIATPVFWNNRA